MKLEKPEEYTNVKVSRLIELLNDCKSKHGDVDICMLGCGELYGDDILIPFEIGYNEKHNTLYFY